ncbi:hypothetical protein V6N13_077983 [Hibiscus sabdariffa]
MVGQVTYHEVHDLWWIRPADDNGYSIQLSGMQTPDIENTITEDDLQWEIDDSAISYPPHAFVQSLVFKLLGWG